MKAAKVCTPAFIATYEEHRCKAIQNQIIPFIQISPSWIVFFYFGDFLIMSINVICYRSYLIYMQCNIF